MKIQANNNSPNFSGYDARRLRGFLMSTNYKNIANEVKAIGQKEGFDVFLLADKKAEVLTKDFPFYETHGGCWAQDRWSIVKNQLLASEIESTAQAIKKFFNLEFNPLQVKLNKETPQIQ